MQIFVFFLYNQAGNKTDEICAPNVLTEAGVSGLRASVPGLRTHGSVHPPRFRSASPGACRDARVPLSSLLAAVFLGRSALRTAKRRLGLSAQSSGRQASPAAWATPPHYALRSSRMEESCSGTSHPLVSLWLCPSLGGGAGVRYSRPRQGPLLARTPARRPRALPPSRSSQTGQGWGRGRDRVRGSPGPGTRNGESGPGQGRGPGPATTHRKNSGEEGLSLVEPASLKPELASFSHLTL